MAAKIALLGTGLMGYPITKRLLAQKHQVQVWNRNFAKAQPLEKFGATAHKTAQNAVKEQDFIITMLPDGQIVEDVLFSSELLNHVKSGTIIIDMSSIEPSRALDHNNRLIMRNIHHLDAPVSGGTKGAEAGSLAIMVGGCEEVFHTSRQVFAPMGRAVHIGKSGAGQLAKLANQAITAITIAAISEATLLIRESGTNLAAFREGLSGGFADSLILQQHGKRMAEGDFTPGGRAKLQLKDLKNVLAEAKRLNLTLPLVEIVTAGFERMIEVHDGADLDHSALFLDLLDINKLSL